MVDPEKLSVTTDDGHCFEASVYPALRSGAPVVVFFPAMGTPSRVYRHFASSLAADGLHVCLPDWRGIASSSLRASRACNFGYRHLVEIDAPAILDAVHGRFPSSRIWLGGHSLGGQISALIATRHSAIQGLLPIASGSVYYACYGPMLRTGIFFAHGIARASAMMIGYFPGDRIGFGGREAIDLMRDWAHVGGSGRYEPIGSDFDYEGRLAELQLPVLAAFFPEDTWAPEKAVDYLLAKMPQCHSEKWCCTEAESGGHNFVHFSWTKHPEPLTSRIAQWVQRYTVDMRRVKSPSL